MMARGLSLFQSRSRGRFDNRRSLCQASIPAARPGARHARPPARRWPASLCTVGQVTELAQAQKKCPSKGSEASASTLVAFISKVPAICRHGIRRRVQRGRQGSFVLNHLSRLLPYNNGCSPYQAIKAASNAGSWVLLKHCA